MKLSAKELLARINQPRPRSLHAMNRLSACGPEDVYLVDGLIEGLALKDDDQVMWAVIALGHLRPFSTKAASALAGMIHHPMPFIRESVMRAMRYGKHTDADVARVVSVLKSDGASSVRAAAARTLGEISKRPCSVNGLLHALKDRTEHVRSAAAISLKLLRPHSPIVLAKIKAVMGQRKTTEAVRSQLESACHRRRLKPLQLPW
jgi:HEAT repeat protein